MAESSGDNRPVAFLGMPGYGTLTAGAANGLYRASRCESLNVIIRPEQSSLLALNMNNLWCHALNLVHQGKRLDYFAMLHTDVEPEEWWLDKLIAEMEARDLDVLGVVVPIKDVRGVTSIALARPDGDNWRTHARLTMREVFRLPETFTSEDVGYPVLLNTGLWVCRFREEWAREVHFTINDRILYEPNLKRYVPQVESEDWYFSRLLHELRLKIGCTRKVRVEHYGGMNFTNSRAWGEQDFDTSHVRESVVPVKVTDWFPARVPGWLTEEEGVELARLAAGKVVLEIGSYCGRSTICLAKTARSVGAVDTFDGRGTAMPGDTLPTFKKNLLEHGIHRGVNVLRGTSAEVVPPLPPIFDLIFIDGSHDYESVRADAEMAASKLRPGGLLVFHDYGNMDPGVVRAVDELVDSGGEIVGRVGTLAVLRPAVQPELAGAVS